MLTSSPLNAALKLCERSEQKKIGAVVRRIVAFCAMRF